MINSLKVLLEQPCPDRIDFVNRVMAMGQTRGLGLTGIITEQSCVCNMTTGGLNHISGLLSFLFAGWQEASRKDIECGFGVYQQKFHILVKDFELWYVEDIMEGKSCFFALPAKNLKRSDVVFSFAIFCVCHSQVEFCKWHHESICNFLLGSRWGCS
jgi:hypothetical protein